MKIMKTILMLLVSAALVFSFAGAGAAEFLESGGGGYEFIGDNSLDGASKEIPVRYDQHMDALYSITIPADIILTKSSDDYGRASYMGADISSEFPTGYALMVSISQSGLEESESWYVTEVRQDESEGQKLGYSVNLYNQDPNADDFDVSYNTAHSNVNTNSAGKNIIILGMDTNYEIVDVFGNSWGFIHGFINDGETPNALSYEGTLTFTVEVSQYNFDEQSEEE